MATETGALHSKRKVHRSPSYPAFDLATAIDKAGAVYREEKRASTTPDVIASHMGYSQAQGPGGRAVSALRQFGLLEENAGRCRISDLGYTLIHFDRDSSEWRQAIVDAATRPPLFRELLEKFGGNAPSDATLKNELLSRGFNPSSVPDVVSAIRNTMSLVNENLAGYNGAEERTLMSEVATALPAGIARTPEGNLQVRVPRESIMPSPAVSNAWTWTLSIPRNVRADLRIAGDVTKADIARLKKQIEFLEQSFEDSPEQE